MKAHWPTRTPMFAFLVLAIGISVTLWLLQKHDQEVKRHELKITLIAQCERGNVLRDVIASFLVSAERARRQPPIEKGDIPTARKYHNLQLQLLRAAESVTDHSNHPTLKKPEIDCQLAYRLP